MIRGGGKFSNQIGSCGNQFGCCFGSGGPTKGGAKFGMTSQTLN